MSAAVPGYHRELVRRLAAALGGRLLGVYAGGSFALGDFDPERSDLDVAAVCRGPLAAGEKQAIVAALRHEALPCPARALELVVYPDAAVRTPSAGAAFALNLNTGARVALRVDDDEGSIERHWFPLDRAILRDAGVTLFGPPPDELFAPIPRELLLPVVRESLEWQRLPGRGTAEDAVLNACRSLRFVREGVWSSKSEGAAWALEHVDDRELVAAALERRGGAERLARERVDRLLQDVIAAA